MVDLHFPCSTLRVTLVVVIQGAANVMGYGLGTFCWTCFAYVKWVWCSRLCAWDMGKMGICSSVAYTSLMGSCIGLLGEIISAGEEGSFA